MGESEVPDLQVSLGAAPLVRDVVVVEGPAAIEFLQGQLSQDVDALPVGAGAPSLLLQPTGKVDAWLRATRTAEDRVVLDVEAGFGEVVVTRLRRFLLRTKATVEPSTWSGAAVRGPGATDLALTAPEGGLVLPVSWPGVEGVDLLGPTGAEVAVATASASALDVVRIEAGVPAMGAEVTETTIPAELGQWLIDASVSFTKGCYTGQELVARIDSRGGNVPRPVRGLRVDGEPPARGAEVTADGAVVGSVTSSGRSATFGSIALAPMARTVAVGAVVAIGEAAATVVELPFR